MILPTALISFLIIILQFLLAVTIPLPRLIERNSIFADHGNCSIECRAIRYKIAEYLVNFDYEMNKLHFHANHSNLHLRVRCCRIENETYLKTDGLHCYQRRLVYNRACKQKSAKPVLVEDVEAQFGRNNLRIQEYSFVAKEIEKIAVYPTFDGDPERGNDLAILKLKEPIKYDRYVTPIKFPIKYTPYSYAGCFTTGWETFLHVKRGPGREKSRDKLLQRFDVRILDDKKCGSIWEQSYNNKSVATYCAALNIRKSYMGCKVDFGSPLTCFEDGGYVLYGLANVRSLHKNCKEFDYTHLGIKIPYVLRWIYGQDRQFASFSSLPAGTQQSSPALNRVAG